MKRCEQCQAWNYENALRCTQCEGDTHHESIESLRREGALAQQKYPRKFLDILPNPGYIPAHPPAPSLHTRITALSAIIRLHGYWLREAELALAERPPNFSEFYFAKDKCDRLLKTVDKINSRPL